MPIYEYRCADCGKKTTIVLLSVSQPFEPRCSHCGSYNVKRLVSRVAVLRSEESRLESMADPSKLSGVDENDPGSVARWMKKMGREFGDELGEDFDQELDQAVEETMKGEEAKPGGEEPAGDAGDVDE